MVAKIFYLTGADHLSWRPQPQSAQFLRKTPPPFGRRNAQERIMDTQKLADKVTVIVGGTSGIGLATARAFREEGAKVVVTGTDPVRLDDALREFGTAAVLAMDVRNVNDIHRAAEAVCEEFGKIDVLFANSGMGVAAPMGSVTEAAFDKQVEINFKGLFFTVQKFAPLLKSGASVILTTSFLNVVGKPGLSVLSATKAAVRSLTRSFAAELASIGVRVNAVSPGPINTPFHGKLGLTAEQLDAAAARIEAEVPMRRFGEAHEVAKAVVYLASDASSFMTGSELVVDGGLSQI
jgi:NAD(P)-dependent dehydrogenase (short-subunit alcohol dehydrogenase family)